MLKNRIIKMKKILYLLMFLTTFTTMAFAQEESKGTAKIVFKETTYDFGQFPETSPKVSCVFYFTNEGDAPLVIHQAIGSCGCTVPQYPKEPIMPGKSGEIKVTYNGKGRYPGNFKKSIRIRTNGEPDIATLYIQGEMTAVSVKKENGMME